MLASSTHDTKRSEDVRARINLLAEMPDAWRAAVSSWTAMSSRWWPSGVEPDRSMEYLLYQVLVGAHPLPADRAIAYFAKASREAKLRTSWLDNDEEYEAALQSFITAALADPELTTALDEFSASLALAGRVASLAHLVLKLTCPGVPDIYQGSELWTDSLVDPDNRREIDFAERRRILHAMTDAPSSSLPPLVTDDVGVSKLWLTRLLLAARTRCPRAFSGSDATYRPLELAGTHAGHGLAYQRGEDVVVVAPVRPGHLVAAVCPGKAPRWTFRTARGTTSSRTGSRAGPCRWSTMRPGSGRPCSSGRAREPGTRDPPHRRPPELRLWAPRCTSVELETPSGRTPMVPVDDEDERGWWRSQRAPAPVPLTTSATASWSTGRSSLIHARHSSERASRAGASSSITTPSRGPTAGGRASRSSRH
jgi:hypothetical protein